MRKRRPRTEYRLEHAQPSGSRCLRQGDVRARGSSRFLQERGHDTGGKTSRNQADVGPARLDSGNAWATPWRGRDFVAGGIARSGYRPLARLRSPYFNLLHLRSEQQATDASYSRNRAVQGPVTLPATPETLRSPHVSNAIPSRSPCDGICPTPCGTYHKSRRIAFP
jgi:hypothetical protein